MHQDLLLQYIRQYVKLTDEEEILLLTFVKTRIYQKNQYILQAGDICRYENFMISGCTRTYYIDNKGNDHTMMFGIENWWSADLASFFTQTPANFSIKCLEKTEVLQISVDIIEQMYTAIPKMERFFRIIMQNSIIAHEKRLVRNFSMSAKERYLHFKTQYPLIEQRVPQYMIASYLGITKEFLSTIRAEISTVQPT